MTPPRPTIASCAVHGDYFADAPDSPCPSCEDAEQCVICGSDLDEEDLEAWDASPVLTGPLCRICLAE